MVDPSSLWFNTPDSNTLCRAGGNGPEHPTQLYLIKKYLKEGMTFLDYGCGSATTYEALKRYYKVGELPLPIRYKGLDIIPKNVVWCKENFPDGDFEVNPTIHKIDQPDQSWDVVYSRHVVDHMNSFEEAMNEHCRVAKKLVLVILWVPFCEGEHQIKHIVDAPGTDQEKTYMDEYTNQYSRSKVKEWIEKKSDKWELLELTEDVGSEVKGHDIVLCLKRKS